MLESTELFLLRQRCRVLESRCDIAESALYRLRKKTCELLRDDPEKWQVIQEECGVCGGTGDCVYR
jgi:hypothetical protein